MVPHGDRRAAVAIGARSVTLCEAGGGAMGEHPRKLRLSRSIRRAYRSLRIWKRALSGSRVRGCSQSCSPSGRLADGCAPLQWSTRWRQLRMATSLYDHRTPRRRPSPVCPLARPSWPGGRVSRRGRGSEKARRAHLAFDPHSAPPEPRSSHWAAPLWAATRLPLLHPRPAAVDGRFPASAHVCHERMRAALVSKVRQPLMEDASRRSRMLKEHGTEHGTENGTNQSSIAVARPPLTTMSQPSWPRLAASGWSVRECDLKPSGAVPPSSLLSLLCGEILG